MTYLRHKSGVTVDTFIQNVTDVVRFDKLNIDSLNDFYQKLCRI